MQTNFCVFSILVLEKHISNSKWPFPTPLNNLKKR